MKANRQFMETFHGNLWIDDNNIQTLNYICMIIKCMDIFAKN